MENYLVCVIALHRLMQIEQILMKDIIVPAHQPRVFELIVREAMDTIVQDGEVSFCNIFDTVTYIIKFNIQII